MRKYICPICKIEYKENELDMTIRRQGLDKVRNYCPICFMKLFMWYDKNNKPLTDKAELKLK